MKIFIETLGCEKNTADSESAAGILERAGHEIVASPTQAEAIMINTCGFINDAKEESIDRIFDMAEYKQNGGILIVTGCLSQRYGEDLYEQLPEVDIFLGVNDYHNLPRILEEHKKGKRDKYINTYEKAYMELGKRKKEKASYSAYLKIAEGCDNVCTYCIIPSIRGRYRSRKKEDILSEAKELAENGCKELILIAQDVTAYGKDLYGTYCLPDLLRALCQIESLHWIRLMYCYEERITDELIAVMASEKKVCHYIDIPIQHGSDAILKSMNRHSTQASITNTITRLREAMPDIHIRTTMITGFPGEKSAEFEELFEFIQKMRFERLGVFAYSKEEGTAAALMKGQVREDVKARRKDKIMWTQRQISLECNQRQIGKTLEVLVEQKEEDGTYIGRSVYDAPEIDNEVLFTAKNACEIGTFVKVKITDAFDYDLTGEMEEEK